jgi:SAM-dependent methyltransferase
MSDGSLLSALYTSDIPPDQTERECDFIQHFLPLADHPRLLDLACETGRHSIELARRGYTTTGIDIDGRALHVARMRAAERDVAVKFIEADIRDIGKLEERFDGILLFWQSFGFFDGMVQVELFTGFRRQLEPGGRVILDLYNKLHFINQPTGAYPRMEGSIEERPATLSPMRHLLGYEDDLRFEERRHANLFDPHLHAPGEIAGLAASHDLRMIAACSNFSPTTAATTEHPRMQLVFERSAG